MALSGIDGVGELLGRRARSAGAPPRSGALGRRPGAAAGPPTARRRDRADPALTLRCSSSRQVPNRSVQASIVYCQRPGRSTRELRRPAHAAEVRVDPAQPDLAARPRRRARGSGRRRGSARGRRGRRRPRRRPGRRRSAWPGSGRRRPTASAYWMTIRRGGGCGGSGVATAAGAGAVLASVSEARMLTSLRRYPAERLRVNTPRVNDGRDRAASSCTSPRFPAAGSAARPTGSSTGSPPPASPGGRCCRWGRRTATARPYKSSSAFAAWNGLLAEPRARRDGRRDRRIPGAPGVLDR